MQLFQKLPLSNFGYFCSIFKKVVQAR